MSFFCQFNDFCCPKCSHILWAYPLSPYKDLWYNLAAVSRCLQFQYLRLPSIYIYIYMYIFIHNLAGSCLGSGHWNLIEPSRWVENHRHGVGQGALCLVAQPIWHFNLWILKAENPRTSTTQHRFYRSWIMNSIWAFGCLRQYGQCVLIFVKWFIFRTCGNRNTPLLPILHGHPSRTLPPKKYRMKLMGRWGILVGSASDAEDAG